MSEDRTVQLNYVIPIHLEDLLTRYCSQNLVSPSALLRQLVLEYVEGDRHIEPCEHPKGRRTTVALPARLLEALEQHITSGGHATKASVIAALLSAFLPNRVLSGETVNIEAALPVEVLNKVYDRYGPGPLSEVIQKALQSVADQIELSKEAT